MARLLGMLAYLKTLIGCVGCAAGGEYMQITFAYPRDLQGKIQQRDRNEVVFSVGPLAAWQKFREHYKFRT